MDNARTWGLFLHLSQLLNFMVPIAGIIVPIVIWQLKKNEFPELDAHGKIVLNWMISALIYAAVGTILTFFIVGFLC